MNTPGFAALAILLGAAAFGQVKGDTPPALNPPLDEKLVLQAHATGNQVYVCRQDANNAFAWILQAPEAQLFDSSGNPIGKHFAGPTWQLSDGSAVKAKVTATFPSPDAGLIPWLLLTAIEHRGSGALRRVTSIQRLHTAGGKAPDSGCDAAHAGNTTRSRYAADYYFYARTRTTPRRAPSFPGASSSHPSTARIP